MWNVDVYLLALIMIEGHKYCTIIIGFYLAAQKSGGSGRNERGGRRVRQRQTQKGQLEKRVMAVFVNLKDISVGIVWTECRVSGPRGAMVERDGTPKGVV